MRLLLLSLALFSLVALLLWLGVLLWRARYLRGEQLALSTLPVFGPLYLQALLSLVRKPRSLSQLVVKLPAIQIWTAPVPGSAKLLARYKEICGFPNIHSEDVPVMFPALQTFALILAALCNPKFPVSVVGGVFVRYRATLTRQLSRDEALMFRLSLDPEVRRTEKGDAEFDFHVKATSASTGEVVWHETTTILCLNPSRQAGGPKAGTSLEEDRLSWEHLDTWELDTSAGRRFAALNGDINPIHLHPATARLLGFRSPIAHGQFVTALCLAALQKRGITVGYPQAVHVEFKRPTPLPSRIAARFRPTPGGGAARLDGQRPTAQGADFAVLSESGRVLVAGSLKCLQPGVWANQESASDIVQNGDSPRAHSSDSTSRTKF